MESINSFFSRVFKIIESLSWRCCFSSGIFVIIWYLLIETARELGFVLGSGLTVESEREFEYRYSSITNMLYSAENLFLITEIFPEAD